MSVWMMCGCESGCDRCDGSGMYQPSRREVLEALGARWYCGVGDRYARLVADNGLETAFDPFCAPSDPHDDPTCHWAVPAGDDDE